MCILADMVPVGQCMQSWQHVGNTHIIPSTAASPKVILSMKVILERSLSKNIATGVPMCSQVHDCHVSSSRSG